MDHNPAGKIETTEILHPSSRSPDPVGKRIIDESRPEEREDQKCGELHALCESADDQGRRDHRKHALENHKDRMRDGLGIIGMRLPSDGLQSRPFKAADNPPSRVRAEGEGITP
jgi:hypothetical protein